MSLDVDRDLNSDYGVHYLSNLQTCFSVSKTNILTVYHTTCELDFSQHLYFRLFANDEGLQRERRLHPTCSIYWGQSVIATSLLYYLDAQTQLLPVSKRPPCISGVDRRRPVSASSYFNWSHIPKKV